jgi:hypothetical protein
MVSAGKTFRHVLSLSNFPAYRVDFNVSLASFEPQLLIVRRFINFALSSPRTVPPSIVFTSSVSVLRSELQVFLTL